MSSSVTCVVVACVVSCIVGAATAAAQTPPAPIEHNGVTYITGGIGKDEVQAFHKVAAGYNLHVTFASKSGQYLSDVDVGISRGEKIIFGIRTDGPFLFVRLPAGRYRITARDRSMTETRQVDVPRKGDVDVRFYWDESGRNRVKRLCRVHPESRR